jgi:hypothetical protein
LARLVAQNAKQSSPASVTPNEPGSGAVVVTWETVVSADAGVFAPVIGMAIGQEPAPLNADSIETGLYVILGRAGTLWFVIANSLTQADGAHVGPIGFDPLQNFRLGSGMAGLFPADGHFFGIGPNGVLAFLVDENFVIDIVWHAAFVYFK